MKTLSHISKALPSKLYWQHHAVPYIYLSGYISSNTTVYLSNMLERLPSNKKYLALLINCHNGCPAQTQIIINKLRQKSHKMNLKVYTFALQCAMNAGYMLLSSGDMIYADRTSLLGGICPDESKIIFGPLKQYLSCVTYSFDPSYESEIVSEGQINRAKKKEYDSIREQMSRQIAVTIKKNRGGLVADNVDLNQFYTGEQAVKLGLIDGLASPQQVFKRIDRESLLSKIDFNATEKIFRMVRRLNLSD